jgi:5-methylcytosine-specific restriction endonuclease McrA
MTEYKQWKQQEIERDGFICRECRVTSIPGHFTLMHVDHIKPLSLILAEYRIVTTEDARVCGELWDTNNGRVLCVTCHQNGDTYAGRVNSLTLVI